MRKFLGIGTVVALGTLVGAASAHAAPVGFNCITNNSAVDCGIGEAQLTMELIDVGGGQVKFEFKNLGPADSSITDVYFDDGTLLGIASVVNGSGVDFSQDADPGDLPGGGAGFNATAGFTADSNPPAQPNGVNPGETLGIIFNLLAGKTFADTLAALAGGTDLVVGIHVQGFNGGGSEAFINEPPVPGDPDPQTVPEPASLALFAAALGSVAVRLRRKRS